MKLLPGMPPSPSDVRLPTRVELEPDGSVDVFVDEDEEALLITAQDGLFTTDCGYHHRRTEELFSCLQKLVIASMTIGLIGLGVAFIFLIEYIAGW